MTKCTKTFTPLRILALLLISLSLANSLQWISNQLRPRLLSSQKYQLMPLYASTTSPPAVSINANSTMDYSATDVNPSGGTGARIRQHSRTVKFFHISESDEAKEAALAAATLQETLLTENWPIDDDLSTEETHSNNDPLINVKQPMLYVPGLDGTGNFSAQSFANLTHYFECWRMYVSPSDRSTFLALADAVIEQVESFDEPPILVGESFGGLLSVYVASRIPDKIAKLVLINPATSFDRTNWLTVGPVLSATGRFYPAVGGLTLLATAVQPKQIVNIGNKIRGRIDSVKDVRREIGELWEGMQTLPKHIPPETLRWRLRNWLGVGSYVVNGDAKRDNQNNNNRRRLFRRRQNDNSGSSYNKFVKVTAPVLILVGARDRLLPSNEEGKRLKAQFTASSRVELRTFKDSGHAILDGTIDLAEVIRDSRVYKLQQYRRTNGGALDLNGFNDYYSPMPSETELEEVRTNVDRYYNAVSPVYISRNAETGRLERGLSNVPVSKNVNRPVLLVGNHQLMGLDLPFLIMQFLREKDTLIRGLAHPFIFQGGADGTQMNNPYTRELFTTFGAVQVSPMSIFKLMKMNQTILLFPGGVREATHKKGEEYQLFWPERTDFVRMAALMDAIVVPFAAIGVADSLNYIADADDLKRLPNFIQSRNKDFQAQIPQARPDVEETWSFPIVAPALPERNYFLFQKPFDTRDLSASNKTACRIAYQEIQSSCAEGIDTLITLRSKDKYRSFIPRFSLEQITRQQAPTPSLEGL